MKYQQLWRFLAAELTEVENPLLEVELLLRKLKGWTKEDFFLRLSEEVKEGEIQALRKLIERRKTGYPLQYLIGEVEFYSRKFFIEEGVFIPRPETEILVEEALKLIKGASTVVDVGTGTGVIAITLALERPSLKVFATDISDKALEIAKKNALFHKVKSRLVFFKTPFLKALIERKIKVDMVISNPPYLRREDLHYHRELKYEPENALHSPQEGTFHIKEILLQSLQVLKKGGWILVEISPVLLPKLSFLYQEFEKAEVVEDLSGKPRVLKVKPFN